MDIEKKLLISNSGNQLPSENLVQAGQQGENSDSKISSLVLFKNVNQFSLISSAHHIFSTVNFFLASKALSNLGTEGLEAAGIISPTVLTMYNSSTGFVRSVGVFTGKIYQDETKHKKIGRVFQQGLVLSGLTSIGTLIFNFCMPPILSQFNHSDQVSNIIKEYLHAYALIIPANIILTNFHDLALVIGDDKSFVISSAFSQLMGAFFGYNLVLGTLGMPKLGPAGYAYATAISTWITNLVYFGYLAQNKFKKYCFFKKYRSGKKDIFLELLSIGWPIGMMILVEKAIQLIDAVMAGVINQNALAAQEITAQFVFFPIVLTYGLSRGVSIAISKTKELIQSKRITKVGITTSLLIFLPVLSVYNALPNQLVSVFSSNNEVQKYAKNLFIVNTIGGLVDSKRISVTACLRGYKETSFPLKMTTLFLIFSLLISYFLGFQSSLNVDGIYIGRNIGLAFSALTIFFGLTHKLNETKISPFPSVSSLRDYFFSSKSVIIENEQYNNLEINSSTDSFSN